jgi:hypothetical protein
METSKKEQIERLRNGLDNYCEKKGIHRVSEITIEAGHDVSRFVEAMERAAMMLGKLHEQLKEGCMPYRKACRLRKKIEETPWPLSLWYRFKLYLLRRRYSGNRLLFFDCSPDMDVEPDNIEWDSVLNDSDMPGADDEQR